MASDENMSVEALDHDTVCTICNAEFLDADDLNVHIDQMHPNSRQEQVLNLQRYCQFCSQIFSSLEDYVYHIRDAHLSTLKCCKYCTRVFTDYSTLRKHEGKHYSLVNKNRYLCSQCKEAFFSIPEVEQHEYKNHFNDDDGVMLHDCYPCLSAILNIKASTFLHKLGTSSNFLCIRCEFQATDVDEYLKHLQVYDCKAFSCDKCSNVYKDKKGLKRHLDGHVECHLNEEELTKECGKCLKQIDYILHSEHVKNCKPIMCSICKIIFDTLHELQEHQSESHPLAISLTRCKFCHREFVGNNQLQKHIDRIHKGQFHLYKYACVYCEETYFKHPKDLFCHLFSKHQDISPYSCKICDKTFRIRKRFTIHIKLEHKSVGFVEFDENYHVFFTDKKSEKPFQPKSLYPETDTSKNDDEEVQTEPENESSKSKNKLKVSFKQEEQTDKEGGFENVCTDFMSATETEANQTDNDASSKKSKLKRKSRTVYSKPLKMKKKEAITTEAETEISESESDNQPLLVVKKREKIKRLCKLRLASGNKYKKLNKITREQRNRFICNICKKYCYTYQNYHHHISMHSRNEVKKCIKCSKEFTSKTELSKHVATEHASSRLTETLKNLLERRKHGIAGPQLTPAEKFQRTIKRVRSEDTYAKVTITEVQDKLSVKNFLESFTPDVTETKKKHVDIDTVVSIKACNFATMKPPVIKMTKFVPKPENTNTKLAMPVKFRPCLGEKHKVNIKLIHEPVNNDNDNEMDNDHHSDNQESFVEYEEDEERNDVPEMAQEVMLEDTSTPKPQPIPHKILIPKLPKEFNKNKIRIAHLLPEAPFFKIVKMDEVLTSKKEEEYKNTAPDNIKLPDGTKLVNVNPLAHLLGGTPVEKIINPTKNYYKAKKPNFEQVIAKAMLKLEKHGQKKTVRKKSAKAQPEVTDQVEANTEEIKTEL